MEIIHLIYSPIWPIIIQVEICVSSVWWSMSQFSLANHICQSRTISGRKWEDLKQLVPAYSRFSARTTQTKYIPGLESAHHCCNQHRMVYAPFHRSSHLRNDALGFLASLISPALLFEGFFMPSSRSNQSVCGAWVNIGGTEKLCNLLTQALKIWNVIVKIPYLERPSLHSTVFLLNSCNPFWLVGLSTYQYYTHNGLSHHWKPTT